MVTPPVQADLCVPVARSEVGLGSEWGTGPRLRYTCPDARTQTPHDTSRSGPVGALGPAAGP